MTSGRHRSDPGHVGTALIRMPATARMTVRPPLVFQECSWFYLFLFLMVSSGLEHRENVEHVKAELILLSTLPRLSPSHTEVYAR